VRYAVNPANAAVSANGTSFQYDGEGRLVARIETTDEGRSRVWRYEWNAESELTAVSDPDGRRWSYAYDALGRRVAKRGPDGSRVFIWDGHDLVHEVHDDRPHRTWLTDPSTGHPLAQIENGVFYSIVTDETGLPREMVDQQGTVAWSADHLSWGSIVGVGPSGVDCPLGFRGQYRDSESGLFYNRFRYFDPTLGSFISRDPVRTNAGFLGYRYAPNPFVWIDPFGLDSVYVVREGNKPDGKVIYVGITSQDVSKREAQHQGIPGRENWQLQPLTDANGNALNVNHDTARGIEQGLIDHYGMKKDGGQLDNKINSMSDSNKKLDKRLEKGDPYVDDFLDKEGEERKRKDRKDCD
jgi:RHS repeat-associated protein